MHVFLGNLDSILHFSHNLNDMVKVELITPDLGIGALYCFTVDGIDGAGVKHLILRFLNLKSHIWQHLCKFMQPGLE